MTDALHFVGKKTIFFNSCDVSKSYSSSDLNVVIVFTEGISSDNCGPYILRNLSRF